MTSNSRDDAPVVPDLLTRIDDKVVFYVEAARKIIAIFTA